ncbi:tRNA pseudouridine(38-40) synthase TruA [Hyphococcus sp.]|uniref:tRNA pseudouridine(38-40) synthase TruA n=1 Tax=Hyphococcus sp. TaxID=2038636 RepID=UPI00208C2F28|nr:MAG: tRNA pseudouridine synthase A [Marinicaulis sp.]
MPRYKMTIEYDGADFVGWQRQDNGLSIQEVIERAVQLFCGEEVTVHSAGRTDSGVHALAMTAHVELQKDWPPNVIRDAVNQHLRPARVAILNVENAPDDFHARFSCKGRAYEYRIINRRTPLALDLGRAWRVAPRLDAEAMDAAAQVLVGKHDFTTFRSIKCQSASPVKTLDEISVSRLGEDIYVRCAARSFLHNQVRSFAGSLVEVGKGKWRARDLKTALETKDRAACGPVAPGEGLYFLRADY